jgi:hypothetical protein
MRPTPASVYLISYGCLYVAIPAVFPLLQLGEEDSI